MKRRHLESVPTPKRHGPFGLAAEQYHNVGWAPIPLPPGKKMPPPKGWTGKTKKHSGEMPDTDRIAEWIRTESAGNIALRLMDGFIAIDADMYDGKEGRDTLARAEEAWGTLPETVMSSARADGSGCRIYRVPKGLKWPGDFRRSGMGRGIELVTWGHRFVVAAPSIHPELKVQYAWRNSITFAVMEGWIPGVEDTEIADLPETWVTGLTEGQKYVGVSVNYLEMEDDEASDWLTERNGPELCSTLDGLMTRTQVQVMRAEDDGGIHDSALEGVWQILMESAKGHSGVTTALASLKKSFAMAMSKRNASRAAGADGEWKRIVFQGIEKAAALHPKPTIDDSCETGATSSQEIAKKVGQESGKIVLGNTPDSIRSLSEALRYGSIPDSYARRGEIVQIFEVQTRRAGKGAERENLRKVALPLAVDSLRKALADHCKVVSPKFSKDGDLEDYVEKSPSVEVLKSVLAQRNWTPLPVLTGLISSPIFRPDGTLLQTAGYDSATGLYYEPERERVPVPPKVDPIEVASYRNWLIEEVFRDFPWVEEADFANYLALMVTPLLRPILGEALAPFGVVTATAPGSGKSLLAEEIPERLYRATSYPWTRREEERQKAITAAFAADSQVVIFDNVGDNDRIDSPALAKLLTSRTWDDRRMGKNTEVLSYTNDRLWMATGNNISLGGDMRSRSVLVRLDPRIENPEFRTGFAMGDLTVWLEDPENTDRLLRALMVMVLDWVSAGMPHETVPMRSFSLWAGALGGFLKHHSIGGFLANASALREADSEEEEWGSFLADLRATANGKALTAAQIHSLYVGMFDTMLEDRAPIPARPDGSTPNVRGLGMMFQKRIGRYFNGLTIDGAKSEGVRQWRVLTQEESAAEFHKAKRA